MGTEFSLGAKELGYTLVVLAVVLGLVFVSTTREMISDADSACVCSLEDGEGACPHSNSIPVQSYLGFILVFAVGGLGAFISLGGLKTAGTDASKLKKLLPTLQEDEKALCGLIEKGGGAVFQSELVEKSGLSKVKVTRILDKLEGKGIIERRRRGMTNLVLLR